MITPFDHLYPVSIHAPARGATAADGHLRRGDYRFNSRAREGRDSFRVVVCGGVQ